MRDVRFLKDDKQILQPISKGGTCTLLQITDGINRKSLDVSYDRKADRTGGTQCRWQEAAAVVEKLVSQ